MSKILDFYNQALNLIPPQYRTILAVIVLIILVFSLIRFLKKNLVWLVIFLLLLPAAYPAIKQVSAIVWGWIQKIPK
jgi:hypothetical protein